MSVGSVAVQLKYGLYVVGHLSKLAFHFMFIVVRLVVVVSSVRLACNVLHICDGRAFELKCNLGKRINQLLKSRQTETNCTPIANVLL
jgi:hypothetical protein